MSGKLAGFVSVQRPDGEIVSYGPDDTVPPEDAKLIVNPLAWETPPTPEREAFTSPAVMSQQAAEAIAKAGGAPPPTKAK